MQATHDVVPPETLAPVLKQLVDQFISDRTRPEVMAIGLKTVRELAARSPLIMTSDLLQVRTDRTRGMACRGFVLTLSFCPRARRLRCPLLWCRCAGLMF